MSDAWMRHLGKRGKVFASGRRARRRTVAGIGRRARIKPEQLDVPRAMYDMGKDWVATAEDAAIAPTEPEKEAVIESIWRYSSDFDFIERVEEVEAVGDVGDVVYRSSEQRAIDLIKFPVKILRYVMFGDEGEEIKDFLLDMRDNTRISKDVRKVYDILERNNVFTFEHPYRDIFNRFLSGGRIRQTLVKRAQNKKTKGAS